MLGHEATQARRRPRPARPRARQVREISDALRLPRRPRRARRGPARRRAAAGRDHQGALARRRGARLRRADRRAHAAGDRRADGDHAPAQGDRAPRSSSSPTSSARCARSPTASPSSGSARSSARRRRPPSNAELASLMVGRAVELTVHKDEPQARRPRRSSSRASRVIDPIGQLVVNDVSFDVRARRDPRDRRRAGQRPDRAHRGAPRPAAAGAGLDQRSTASELVGLERPHDPRRRASASCPRTATRTASSASSRSPRTSCSTASTARPSCRRATSSAGVLAEFAREKVQEFDVRTQGIDAPVGTLSGGNQQKVVLARELSRELRAPRRRAAHARRRRRLDRVHPQAHRRDPRCRRPGHRRLDRARRGRRRSPTASWSCTAAASSASCPATRRETCSAS